MKHVSEVCFSEVAAPKALRYVIEDCQNQYFGQSGSQKNPFSVCLCWDSGSTYILKVFYTNSAKWDCSVDLMGRYRIGSLMPSDTAGTETTSWAAPLILYDQINVAWHVWPNTDHDKSPSFATELHTVHDDQIQEIQYKNSGCKFWMIKVFGAGGFCLCFENLTGSLHCAKLIQGLRNTQQGCDRVDKVQVRHILYHVEKMQFYRILLF